ncbi:MAG: hypothetical protein AAGC95_15565 [Pseudomonadota bacterium]
MLKTEAKDIDARLTNLWDQIGRNDLELDDVGRRLIQSLQAKRASLGQNTERLEASRQTPIRPLQKRDLTRLANEAPRRLTNGSEPCFARAYLRALVERVTIGNGRVHIRGNNLVLLKHARL